MTFGGATYGNSAYGDTGAASNIEQLEANLTGQLNTNADLSKNKFLAADLSGSLNIFADIEPVVNLRANLDADFTNNQALLTKNILLSSNLSPQAYLQMPIFRKQKY